jgi:hypothetical protein
MPEHKNTGPTVPEIIAGTKPIDDNAAFAKLASPAKSPMPQPPAQGAPRVPQPPRSNAQAATPAQARVSQNGSTGGTPAGGALAALSELPESDYDDSIEKSMSDEMVHDSKAAQLNRDLLEDVDKSMREREDLITDMLEEERQALIVIKTQELVISRARKQVMLHRAALDGLTSLKRSMNNLS